MSARVVWIVALAVALVTSVTTALVMTVLADDGPGFGRRAMSGGMPRGMPGGMSGGMHGMRVASEYAYLAEMIAHHEEAITAAEELQRSPREEMRDFGEAIVESQSAQVEQMQEWLAEWYPDRRGEVDYEPMMRDLSDLSGDRLDRVFLEDMIGHHMAAVMMSQQLLAGDLADHDEVETLAQDIRDEQHDEIFQMQEWLQEWFDVDWHGMRGMARHP